MATEERRPRLPAEAKALQRRIEAWRATRRNGAPMPEGLWDGAVALAQEHGAYVIARGLPVDYGALKARLDRCPAADGGRAAQTAAFVELDAARLLGGVDESGPVVKLARPDGARMVVRLPRSAPLDLASLVAAFCGGGA